MFWRPITWQVWGHSVHSHEAFGKTLKVGVHEGVGLPKPGWWGPALFEPHPLLIATQRRHQSITQKRSHKNNWATTQLDIGKIHLCWSRLRENWCKITATLISWWLAIWSFYKVHFWPSLSKKIQWLGFSCFIGPPKKHHEVFYSKGKSPRKLSVKKVLILVTNWR